MGDHNPNLLLLPPGCRFFPSDEQLLCVYLKNKISGDDRRSVFDDLIKEIDLYDFEPFNLPDSVCFRFGRGGRKRHYYCYVARVSREEERRRAGTGFWKRSGRVRDVFVGGGTGKGKVVVGRRKSFVFYLGDFVGGASKTDWFMHEYAMIESHLAPFVLCRVFVKTRRSNRSERALSSCGEGSVATVRHIGVQHDGTVKLATNESNLLGRKSPDHNSNALRFPMGMVRELDNPVIGWPVDMQMRSFGRTNARDVILDPLTAQQLTAILEDDFLELDDLVSPLLGID